MAYKQKIVPNSVDSHQTSPSYVLTFIRFANRDTANDKSIGFDAVQKTLVVVSDCISLSVSHSKSSVTASAQMVLGGGDVNYSTAVSTGDFVMINMVDDEVLASDIADRARSGRPINKFKDGFKGVYRVQTVRRNLKTNKNGMRSFFHTISAAGFTEMNQVIYFNRYLTLPTEEQRAITLRLNNAILGAQEVLSKNVKGQSNLNTIFKNFIGLLIGEGFGDLASFKNDGTDVKNFNRNFIVPKEVLSLLGVKKGRTAADMYRFYVGVEKYSSNARNKEAGLNPLATANSNFYDSAELSGRAYVIAEFWAQVTAWSILQQYQNSVINEMFTTYKYTPDGKVMPCVVFRQKPFTSEIYKGGLAQTKFLSLPRWEIDPKLILDYDLGKDESTRINFVQIVGNNRDLPTNLIGLQTALGGFKLDSDDISRSGMRPYIQTSSFDIIDDKGTQAPVWNEMVFDWLNGLHLRENGKIVTVGLYEPLSVGENLQIGTTVYHIETLTHIYSISPKGEKSFETTIGLSFGVEDAKFGKVYPESRFQSTDEARINDPDQIYGGFSDDQSPKQNIESNKKTFQQALSTIKNKIGK